MEGLGIRGEKLPKRPRVTAKVKGRRGNARRQGLQLASQHENEIHRDGNYPGAHLFTPAEFSTVGTGREAQVLEFAPA